MQGKIAWLKAGTLWSKGGGGVLRCDAVRCAAVIKPSELRPPQVHENKVPPNARGPLMTLKKQSKRIYKYFLIFFWILKVMY